MFRFSVSVIMLSTAALMGCSESVVKSQNSISQPSMLLQADVDLMIHKAKTQERGRVQAEYAQQALTASIFAKLKKLHLPELAGNCLAKVVVPAQILSSDSAVQISKERMSYRVVVCTEHYTFQNIIKLQASLRDKGFLKSVDGVDKVNPTEDVSGGLNGLWDDRTARAMAAYQKANGLAYGVDRVEWTLESLRYLDLL